MASLWDLMLSVFDMPTRLGMAASDVLLRSWQGLPARIQDSPEPGLDDPLLAEPVTRTLETTGTPDGSVPLWVWILVLVLLVGMLLLVFLFRNRQQEAQDTENALFEDQYGVHDEEIEIEGSLDQNYAEVVIEETEDDDRLFADDDEDGTGVQSVSANFDDEPAEIELETEDEILSGEEDTPEKTAAETENVIRFKTAAEQEHEAPAEETETAPAAARMDADSEEDNRSGEGKVSYAYAASRTGPIAFSNISSESDETSAEELAGQAEKPATSRAYIAPTVLREDMEKIEKMQSAKMDEVRADLGRQISAMKAEHNNRLDLIINALDRRLEGLAEATRLTQEGDRQSALLSPEVQSRMTELQASLDNQGQRIRAITQILDDRLGSVSHIYGEVRNTNERLEDLSKKLESMEKSFTDKTQSDVIADVQLSDVIRSSLSPDNYEFKPLLSNNSRADCLIKLPHPPGAIVVDTKFPLDAFNALPAREDIAKGIPQAKAAEDAFRRAVLRHIIDVAERYIIPGETADSALLFLPTEAIYTTLHARFPDLVRDSFRARVWIVSPSTLMGTLQTLRGVLRDSRERQEAETVRRETGEVMAEIDALRSQASMLARNFESTQTELRSLLDATDRVMSHRQPARPAPEQPQQRSAGHPDLMELYDHKPEWPGRSKDAPEKTGNPSNGNGNGNGNGHRSTSLFEENDHNPDKLR